MSFLNLRTSRLLSLAVPLLLFGMPAAIAEDAGAGKSDAPQSPAAQSQPSGGPAAKPLEAGDKKPYADQAVKHYNRGVELHQSGFLNQAIAEYKSAIEADARMEEAYSNIGLIYAAQRNYTKAQEAFSKALSLKAARPTTLNGLGTVLYARGKVPEAMEKWKQAIAIDPQFASAYYNMGNALENEKEYSGALEAYVKAIKINPGMADAYYRIGTIFKKERHAAQASVLLSKALELGPEAEFVRDAKKQLSELESEIHHEASDEPEVQMNVMPPPSGSPSPEAAPAPGDLQPAPPAGGGTSPSSSSSIGPRGGNMFIQLPPGQN